MLSSIITSIEEFFLTGLVSLAIIVATVRAHFARFSVDFEWAGFLGVFLICLILTLGLYLYLAISQCCSWQARRRGSADEEWSAFGELEVSSGRRFHVLPVILNRRCFHESSMSPYRGRGRGIRLDDSGLESLGEALLEHNPHEQTIHIFPPRSVNDPLFV
ncbi:hypothetical protein CVT25_001430 [Psilocybe cyanescens]|uniref:Uncharacterized protein n=1 Tax=Psilocybe cyanescens TaxID=93625 RepID=A0A409WNQ7_PSICY|nr:hypothetical protein CVT25_001430 [Psilocybe cyanescens]